MAFVLQSTCLSCFPTGRNIDRERHAHCKILWSCGPPLYFLFLEFMVLPHSYFIIFQIPTIPLGHIDEVSHILFMTVFFFLGCKEKEYFMSTYLHSFHSQYFQRLYYLSVCKKVFYIGLRPNLTMMEIYKDFSY